MTAHPRLSIGQRLARQSLKRILYSQLALRSAGRIARGQEAPFLEFRVEDTPPSLYINFALDEAKLGALAAELRLPQGLVLAPIRCREGDPGRHVLTLNAYRVSGLTHALRAEWSVYVRDDSGKARYLIVEARSSTRSLDPIELFTVAHRVEHGLDGAGLRTYIESSTGAFSARVPVPDARHMQKASITREWVEANDFIYWRNGVADRVFYGGSLASARALSIPSTELVLEDTTPWRTFVDTSQAPQVIAFMDAIELVISPWWNL